MKSSFKNIEYFTFIIRQYAMSFPIFIYLLQQY